MDFILNYPKSLETAQQEAENTKENKMLDNNIPLNQILYGPPGTGKTYHTIDKALEILGYVEWNESEKKFELNEKALEKLKGLPFDTGTMSERDKKKALFDKFMEQGQIGFVTFHQSYGYEDFVEGIRPRLSGENDESQISEKMEYEIRDGIFKSMCKEAQTKGVKITYKTKVWKMSLGEKSRGEAEELQKHCFDSGVIRIGFDNIDDKTSVPNFFAMNVNDIVCVLYDNKTISLVGVISGEVKGDEGVKLSNRSTDHFKRFRKVRWLNTLDDRIDIYALNGNTALTQQTTYELTRIKPIQILERIKKPYILIIDEINRGNISKILGELITLLEPSKRKGEKEALEVKLPYSKEPFSVPNNLYIIGTMNTADRSIALLDTALRRRFEFIEMMPNSSELSTTCDDINLQELLKVMNNRIEFLLDRERTIGHAFFIDVKNLNDLQAVFKNKILPLLQEYFYDDYAKINAVLNDNGMLESKTMRDMKISLSDEFVDSEKKIWTITDSSQWKRWNFQKIYDNNAKKNPSLDNTESSMDSSANIDNDSNAESNQNL
ncbi:McrB family protein [Helicobacter bilis]|uniref:McrB family protein n=1 Tax=Helicobacter bilis TaxID=37372 RepID=UPI00397B73D5